MNNFITNPWFIAIAASLVAIIIAAIAKKSWGKTKHLPSSAWNHLVTSIKNFDYPIIVRKSRLNSLQSELKKTTNELQLRYTIWEMADQALDSTAAELDAMEKHACQLENEITHLKLQIKNTKTNFEPPLSLTPDFMSKNTGETCALSGVWESKCDCKLKHSLKTEDRLPPCPQHGTVSWLLVPGPHPSYLDNLRNQLSTPPSLYDPKLPPMPNLLSVKPNNTPKEKKPNKHENK